MAQTQPDDTTGGRAYRLFRRIVDARPEEIAALAWSWLYILAVFASYYVIRPIRDEIGIAGGIENLPWLFTATLLGMLAVNPPFAALVAKLPRNRFISITYRFFMANLVLFFLLLKGAGAEQSIWIGRVFFVWTSIFNLFVVSIFWALMVDLFNAEQGKRLFGFISAGATLGGIMGSSLTAALAQYIPPVYLLLISAVLLEVAVFSVRRLSRLSEALTRDPAARGEKAVIGGGALAGIANAFKSPYLLGIAVYMLLYSITSTFLYFEQAAIVRDSFADRAARTAFFARLDLIVNVLTLTSQIFLTERTLRTLGVALTLTLVPALTAVGFGALAVAPTLAILVAFQVLRRAGNFAFARPTREVLFTVVPREDKYKTKNFIDTAVYRTGDQVGAWSYALFSFLGMGLTAVAFAAVPLAAAWLVNGWWLGRKQEALASRENTAALNSPA
ncbi:MAG TPA: MFS transporter [Candidatus Binatia bacterium]|jgi:AAA family ATP:ADP antiporter